MTGRKLLLVLAKTYQASRNQTYIKASRRATQIYADTHICLDTELDSYRFKSESRKHHEMYDQLKEIEFYTALAEFNNKHECNMELYNAIAEIMQKHIEEI